MPGVLGAVVALAGCGGSGDATAPDAPQVEPALDPPPPAGGQQLASNTFHLPAGTEHYMCYQFRSPADAIAITRVTSISGVGIHHLAVYQAFGREEAAAPHECDTLIKETWLPVFVSGTGSRDLQLPAGTGFPIAADTQYIMQLHLQNTTDGDLDVRAGVNLEYNHAPDLLIAAGIYGIGNQKIDMPAGATDYQVHEHCAPDREMNVFAVLGHMHKLGTALEVTSTPADAGSGQVGSAAPFYKIDPWTFGDQPIAPMTATVKQTDSLDVTCHWNNPGTTKVGFGESSDDEMCYFVLFYYPFTGLDGCVN